MLNSKSHFELNRVFMKLFILSSVSLFAPFTYADQAAQGFALQRFYSSAAGAGWLVMDALDMHGDWGAAIQLTNDYAKNPLTLSGLTVVSAQDYINLGVAVTYQRYRLYLDIPSPAYIKGNSGSAAGYSYNAPSVDWAAEPDTISDLRIGFDARIFGEFNSPFRMGLGGQVYLASGPNPEGNRADYDSDAGNRAMFRLLAAGDQGQFTYAAQVGIHLRSLNDYPTPGSPEGNEFLLGVAAGIKLSVGAQGQSLIAGIETYESTAFQHLFYASASAIEALISCRYEAAPQDNRQFKFKLGAGPGINPQFGAAEWRAVLAVELAGWISHANDSHPTVTVSKDH